MRTGKRTRCALDVGTTAARAVVVESLPHGVLKLLGAGMAPCSGMNRGQPVNVDETISAIEDAIQQAEENSGQTVETVDLALTTEHVLCTAKRAAIDITRNPRDTASSEITAEHVRTVVQHARKEEPLAIDRQYLHILPQDFTVDGIGGIQNPVGINGLRLEGRVQLVSIPVTARQNLVRCVERAALNVGSVSLEILGAAELVLRRDEKDLGVALLDIGGGTTDLAIWQDGRLRHLAVFGMGGEIITRDITMALHTPHQDSERIKRRWGCCTQKLIRREERFDIDTLGRQTFQASRSQLCQVIQARVDEILDWVEQQLRECGMLKLMGAGMVLTGGSSQLYGLPERCVERFGVPVRTAVPDHVLGLEKTDLPCAWTGALGAAWMAWSPMVLHDGDSRGPLNWLSGSWRSVVRSVTGTRPFKKVTRPPRETCSTEL
ncbi:MAG: cell division protein FtsA [Calditrichaeota bacterium]|nr:cell division protein FtsA [Candidatus Cloacimonadota bacterium]MCB1045756.1 cell division protein FtsA [Calditrichota bacterium]MCB9472248.1 cell division protein FtsA [Candidatus Delongbacteria bacterium]